MSRVLLGLVADAQLDRVHAELDGELVDRGLEREGADRFARGAHEGVGEHVHLATVSTSKQKVSDA